MLDILNHAFQWSNDDSVLIPQPIQAWLLDQGSLTERLKQQSASQVTVKVHQQQVLTARYADLSNTECAIWSRQVQLYNQSSPLIEAHTLVLADDLTHTLAPLCQLGQQPLGEYLFSQPTLQRSPILISQLGDLWLRKSVFTLHNCPIVVAEMFYPDVFNAL